MNGRTKERARRDKFRNHAEIHAVKFAEIVRREFPEARAVAAAAAAATVAETVVRHAHTRTQRESEREGVRERFVFSLARPN